MDEGKEHREAYDEYVYMGKINQKLGEGAVYTFYQYQQAVEAKGITMSMFRKGTSADNAPIESFILC